MLSRFVNYFTEIVSSKSFIRSTNNKIRIAIICLITFLIPFDLYYIGIYNYGLEYCLWRLPLIAFLASHFYYNFYLFIKSVKDNDLKTWIDRLEAFDESKNDKMLHEKDIEIKSDNVRMRKNDQINTDKYGNFCEHCLIERVVRSHHCYICNVCVLRKDHHCFFLGGCVGISNQRYFFLTCFWLSILVGYGLSFYVELFFKKYEPFKDLTWLYFISPFQASLYCYFYYEKTIFEHVLLYIFYIHVYGFLLGGVFCLYNLFLIISGKTQYDDTLVKRYKYDLKPDGNTINERLQFIFGKYWYLNILIPNYWQSNVINRNMIKNILYPSSREN
uniref:Palmitoyltransferase n=1 Tax=Parastrongyloides trichosuri TaxID=131310 RepID=A0A0N4ZTK9_PARTI